MVLKFIRTKKDTPNVLFLFCNLEKDIVFAGDACYNLSEYDAMRLTVSLHRMLRKQRARKNFALEVSYN